MKSRSRVIEEAFSKLNCVFLSIYHIENIRKTAYDSKNPFHEEKLIQVKLLLNKIDLSKIAMDPPST